MAEEDLGKKKEDCFAYRKTGIGKNRRKP